MIISSIVQDTIIENERYTGDSITGEVFSISELFPEDATQQVVNNYGKEPLSAYKETSDPETLYHQQAMISDDRKYFLLAMIKQVTDQIKNGNLSLIRREKIQEWINPLPGL